MWSELQFILITAYPWSLDGLRAGQPGLDSRQGQDVSLLHNVQTGFGARPASYPVSTGALSLGG
jgi:hypothetical protein